MRTDGRRYDISDGNRRQAIRNTEIGIVGRRYDIRDGMGADCRLFKIRDWKYWHAI